MLKFSIVIAIYNEEQSIIPLYSSLDKTMSQMQEPYEIIFVNDCSTDRSPEVLKSINPKDAKLIVLNLHKHSGQSQAIQAGFDAAKGDFIITMDGDLQNDPQDIPKLWYKINEGYDVVCGWRQNRKDPRIKVWSSGVANTIRKVFFGEKIHDVGCSLRIFKREVLEKIYLSGGMHRFFSLIVLRLGYKTGEVKVQHHLRKYGKSKYNLINRLPESMIDFIRIYWFDINELMKRR